MLPVECPEPLPGAKGLTAAPDPTVSPPQAPALQLRGSAAPLAAAAPAQQHEGAAEGADKAVPGSSEVAGTWGGMCLGDGGGRGAGDCSCGAQCSFLSLQKTGKALLALNRLALLSQGTERRASEAQDEEGDGPEALAPMHPINPCSSALSSPPLP